MDEKMICVPYSDFVDGVTARADLDSVRAIIAERQGYCSDGIMAVLGLPLTQSPLPETFEEILQDAGTD